jgi:hypothetical protein
MRVVLFAFLVRIVMISDVVVKLVVNLKTALTSADFNLVKFAIWNNLGKI